MTRLAALVALLASFAVLAQDAVRTAEHLSPYGLAKPVLVVAAELPKDFENKDALTVLNVQADAPPAGFQFLKAAGDPPEPGKVGLFVPAEAVFQIKGRAMSNAGKGVVTIVLAKSSNRLARSVELEGKKTADYNELRRCAMERAAGSPYPPKEPGVPVVPKGTLVIVGGGGMTPEIGKRFLDAGGGVEGHFVVLPVSMPDPIKTQAEETFLRRLGAKHITVLPQREQKDLETPEVIDVLKEATGLWFGGGRQWNFVDAYEGTKLPALFREVLGRNGVIGGSSAGATIQGDYMVRGAPAGPNIMMCEGYEHALGFLPGVGIDQHFTARNRFKDMAAFVTAYPQFLGIGLDEATAIVVQGSTAEVLGKGKVHFYDRKKPVKAGEPDYEAFPAGSKYDLAKRAKINDPPAAIPVILEPGDPTSKIAPRYSPKGRQLKLEPKDQSKVPGFDHLEARLQLGPNAETAAGHLLVLARSAKGKPYDRLFVDSNGEGKLAEKPVVAEPKTVRNNIWSSFETTVRVNHAKLGGPPAFEEYPLSVWVVVEKEGDVPDLIRISRRGFLNGAVRIGGDSFDVVLSDSNNDGVFGPGDWWELRGKAPVADGMRSVGDYAWAGGKAWKLELEGTNGRKAKLVSFDPGLTEAEDVLKRDRLREDRLAKRADKPVAFRKDVDATLKDVADKKAAYFIKFETDWCVPCKQMAELVFTAKDVVEAAGGVTCLIVDGDARKDLTEKHQVKGYPTGILFDVDGKEIARYTGYQSVRETAAFFKKAK